MASTYTDIGTELMTTGENAGNWGTKTNTNLQILEEAIRGYVSQSIAGGVQTTALTYTDGSTGDSARNAVVELSGTITGNQTVTVTAKEKWWVIKNSTSGAYTVQVLVSGQTGVTWAATDKGAKILYCNGTDVIDTNISSNELTSGTGDITLDSAADIVIDAAGGNVEFKDAGTTQLTLDMDTTAGVQILKLGVDSDDLVFQQYDGSEVVRMADDRRLYFYDKGGEYIYGDGTDLHITSGADINIPADIGMTFGNDGEKIEGDGTDLTISGAKINLTATSDVVIPANVGITFGTGEKIEGDSTDLTITSGAKINLTATSDVVIPANVGITFGTGEKIEGDSTDLTITSGADINLTATADVNLPNDVGMVFGDDGEKIEGDGTDLTISSSALATIDAGTDIILDADGGDIFFKDGGTTFGSATNTSGDLIIKSGTTTAATFSGANVTFAGTLAGGGTFTAGGSIVIPDAGNIGSASDTDAVAISSAGVVALSATTEASATGTAALTLAGGLGVAKDVWIGDDLVLDSDSTVLKFGDDQDTTLTHTDGTGLTLNSTNKICFNDTSQFVHGSSATVLSIGATDEIDLTATAIDINGTCDVSGTLTNGSTAVNIAGKQTIWVPSNAMNPTESNPCADITSVETTSGRPDMRVLDFDKDSDEHAQFSVAFPKSWNLGTVTFQVFWSGLAATGGVSWGLQGVACGDNDTIDTAYGTAIVVDDTEQGAVEEVNVSAESGAVTIAGSPADDQLCFFRIFRDVSDSNDDSGGDARLHGVKLFYTTDAANDD